MVFVRSLHCWRILTVRFLSVYLASEGLCALLRVFVCPNSKAPCQRQAAAKAEPCKMSGRPVFGSRVGFITERAELLLKTECQCSRLADLNLDAVPRLESRPFQPPARDSDFG